MTQLPALQARTPRPDDYAQYALWFSELRIDDPLPSLDRWGEQLSNTLFYEDATGPVAYAYFEILADTGYVRNMVVDPAARGRGIARAVMSDLERRFRAAGCVQWCLNVKPENRAAIRVYESVGLRAAFRARALRIRWEHVGALPPGEPGWTVQPAMDAENEWLEQRFGLERGLIAARCRRSAVHVLSLREGADALGLACYDVEFGGAAPFAAVSASAARALLEAMHALSDGAAEVKVVVQDDPALCQALEHAGASVSLEVAHYRASL